MCYLETLLMQTPNTLNNADGFYSSAYYASNLIDMLSARHGSETEKPFFAFLPFSAPHWPLQCLPEDRDKFKGWYDDGPAALRERRLAGLISRGLVAEDVRPHEVVAKTAEWEQMTDEERRLSARAMEVYAGMVHSMDRAIGEVIEHLKKTGEYENTLIIFQSDNGAEGAALGELIHYCNA